MVCANSSTKTTHTHKPPSPSSSTIVTSLTQIRVSHCDVIFFLGLTPFVPHFRNFAVFSFSRYSCLLLFCLLDPNVRWNWQFSVQLEAAILHHICYHVSSSSSGFMNGSLAFLWVFVTYFYLFIYLFRLCVIFLFTFVSSANFLPTFCVHFLHAQL